MNPLGEYIGGKELLAIKPDGKGEVTASQVTWRTKKGIGHKPSPVMVGDRIYTSNVSGKTFVFEATPSHFKLLAQNQLGDEAYASPVICGSRVYLRVAKRGENRQEFLYCVGNDGSQAAR